jgi:hypothetical protein
MSRAIKRVSQKEFVFFGSIAREFTEALSEVNDIDSRIRDLVITQIFCVPRAPLLRHSVTKNKSVR